MKLTTKSRLVLGAVSCLALVNVAGAAELEKAENGYFKQKVVYHVNDLATAKAAMRNVKNHLQALGNKNVEIRVVTHGVGSTMLVEGTKDAKGEGFSDTIASLSNDGVKFYICKNTIRGLKIDEKKIDLRAKQVPSGVAEIAHLQQQGFQYMKP